jgi:hypothetical protein
VRVIGISKLYILFNLLQRFAQRYVIEATNKAIFSEMPQLSLLTIVHVLSSRSLRAHCSFALPSLEFFLHGREYTWPTTEIGPVSILSFVADAVYLVVRVPPSTYIALISIASYLDSQKTY